MNATIQDGITVAVNAPKVAGRNAVSNADEKAKDSTEKVGEGVKKVGGKMEDAGK